MCQNCINRRTFLGVTAAMTAGATMVSGAVAGAASDEGAAWPEDLWNPDAPFLKIGKPLRVAPILMYALQTPREMASWKSWGDVRTREAANEEASRIQAELKSLAEKADFSVEILPVIHVTTLEEATNSRVAESDVTIVYPATGSSDLLNAAIPERGGLIFVRHLSGPVYYWYEALNARFLKTDKDPKDCGKRVSIHDVVVDDTDELLWRLRALFAARNFIGARILAIGGPQGKYDSSAPKFARERFKFDIVDFSYEELGKRISGAMGNSKKMEVAAKWADKYLSMPNTKLSTERAFVVNAFMLYGVFRDVMRETGVELMTINQCMSTILPMSKTTACLTLGLLNDDGYAAFCESDFVVVPAGVFLRYLTGKAVFMHNSTFPHNGVVTCAHCTAPRRMDGKRYESVEVLTHYESDYGAAPKVEIPKGQELTFISPEYATGRWVGIRGVVEGNPFLEICRSQQDVRIHGNWKRLMSEVRDSHWMMVYGDYSREIAYVAPRVGVELDDVSTD